MSPLTLFWHRLPLILLSFLALAMSWTAGAASVVNVEILRYQSGPVLAPDFIGLSFEMNYVLADTNGNHFFSPQNQRLIATFKTLGVKSLRVGGNTADRPTLPTPNQADVDNLFAFAKAAEVKVIYTLRIREGSLAGATEMANYIMRHYPEQLDCFAIGNEPNVFSKEYAPYLAEWKRYATQITAPTNSPNATFCGPSTSPGHESWANHFAIEFGHRGPLALIAQHDYPGGDARRATNAAAAREKILSPAIDAHYARFAASWVPAALTNGLPYRVEEANSFYDGGALDVSDTFAAALWALDYQWWWASHGASGINFHTGDKVAARDESKPCRYAVFWTTPAGYDVHPIAYALKMFSLGGRGRLLPTRVENEDHPNIAVYAAAADQKTIFVTLINREHDVDGRVVQLNFDQALPEARADVMFLAAPENNIAAKNGVTLGGAEIQDDATWRGKWTSLPDATTDGKFDINLPCASAALIKITTQ
ncbi:MAG TPA: hypothetical protein VNZ25_04615 [Candidatus Angelobacter sp.]|jgi:hypothetical protein|nr:hypothetical protein [Candidatus Angelobacter sp.]